MAEAQLLKYFYKKNSEMFDLAEEFEAIHAESSKLLFKTLESYQLLESTRLGALHVDSLSRIAQLKKLAHKEKMKRASILLSESSKDHLIVHSNGISKEYSYNTSREQSKEQSKEQATNHRGNVSNLDSELDSSTLLNEEIHLDIIQHLPQVLRNLQIDFQYQLQTLQSKLMIEQTEKYETIVTKMLALQYQVEAHYTRNMDNFQEFARERDQYGVVRYISRYLDLLNLICTGYIKEMNEKCEILANLKEKLLQVANRIDSRMDEDSVGVHATLSSQSQSDTFYSPDENNFLQYYRGVVMWLEKNFEKFSVYHYLRREWVNELTNLKMRDDRFDHLIQKDQSRKMRRVA